MKAYLFRHKFSWFAICATLTVVVVLACNLWTLCCGQCVIEVFMRISIVGWLLIGANLAALAALVGVRRHRVTSREEGCCRSCGVVLRDDWHFCPDCGSVRR